MRRDDRNLILRIETGGLTTEEEDALVNAILRVVKKHSVGSAHVEIPLELGDA